MRVILFFCNVGFSASLNTIVKDLELSRSLNTIAKHQAVEIQSDGLLRDAAKDDLEVLAIQSEGEFHGKQKDGLKRFEIQSASILSVPEGISEIGASQVVEEGWGSIPLIHAEFPTLPASSLVQKGTSEGILSAATTRLTATFLLTVTDILPAPVLDGQELDVTFVKATLQNGTELSLTYTGNDAMQPGLHSCDGHPPQPGHMVLSICSKISDSTALTDMPTEIVNITLNEARGSNSSRLAAQQASQAIRAASNTMFIVDHKIFEDVLALLEGNTGRQAMASKNTIINSQQVSEGAALDLTQLFGRFGYSLQQDAVMIQDAETRASSIPLIRAEYPLLPESGIFTQGSLESSLGAASAQSTGTFLVTLHATVPPPDSDGQEVDMTFMAVTLQNGTMLGLTYTGSNTLQPGTYSCEGHSPKPGHMVLSLCSKISDSTSLADVPTKIVNVTLNEVHGSNNRKLAAQQVSRAIGATSNTMFIVDHKIFEDVLALVEGNTGRQAMASKNTIINSQQVSEGAALDLTSLFGRFGFSLQEDPID